MQEGRISLPFFQPHDEFGLIEVSKPSDRSGAKYNDPLFLNRHAVDSMELGAAYREILQNWLDEMVSANGQSFQGLKFAKETRGNDRTAFVCHNDKFIFGEIIQDSKQISFVNMGPNIENVEQLLHIGASKKKEKKNQAGQHGEGLKRAALKFLVIGYRIEAFFSIKTNQDVEFRHIIFKIHDKLDCLAYSLSSLKPYGENTFHSFPSNYLS